MKMIVGWCTGDRFSGDQYIQNCEDSPYLQREAVCKRRKKHFAMNPLGWKYTLIHTTISKFAFEVPKLWHYHIGCLKTKHKHAYIDQYITALLNGKDKNATISFDWGKLQK
jgi:hypothetical protein